MMVDFQSYAGPGDKGLRSSEIEGYQPVSRIGEVVMNAFGTRTAAIGTHRRPPAPTGYRCSPPID